MVDCYILRLLAVLYVTAKHDLNLIFQHATVPDLFLIPFELGDGEAVTPYFGGRNNRKIDGCAPNELADC
jgi:hypothetical protein